MDDQQITLQGIAAAAPSGAPWPGLGQMLKSAALEIEAGVSSTP